MEKSSIQKKALVMGFFSTIGDVSCLKYVTHCLEQVFIPYDVAPYTEPPRKKWPGAVDPRTVDALTYTHLIIVCGPCWEGLFPKYKIDLSRFRHCLRIGVNLTMIDPVEEWNPFHILIERDSDRSARPDLSFLDPVKEVPLVGRCLVSKQGEYGDRQRHDPANRAINDLIDRRGLAVVDIDTGWPGSENKTGLKDADQVYSLLKRTDVLLTTRLHGLVYALKAGIPVIAVDAIAGGDKVTAQARTIGWPMIIQAEKAEPEWMDQALDWCLSSESREMIRTCLLSIDPSLGEFEKELLKALATKGPIPEAMDLPHKEGSMRWLHHLFRT